MERLTKERSDSECHILERETQLDRLALAESYTEQMNALAERFATGLESTDFEQRRTLVRLLVEEVVYHEGNLQIKTILPLEQLHPVAGGLG